MVLTMVRFAGSRFVLIGLACPPCSAACPHMQRYSVPLLCAVMCTTNQPVTAVLVRPKHGSFTATHCGDRLGSRVGWHGCEHVHGACMAVRMYMELAWLCACTWSLHGCAHVHGACMAEGVGPAVLWFWLGTIVWGVIKGFQYAPPVQEPPGALCGSCS
jgi:hypothetical protein